jgi:hypothetical protein
MVCQDVLLIDRSAFFGDSDDDEPDEHEDMRLDVDNMSYEVRILLNKKIKAFMDSFLKYFLRLR